jgi:hypothetical protein
MKEAVSAANLATNTPDELHNENGEEHYDKKSILETIEEKRREKLPPFLFHPLLAIVLFIYGANPYILTSDRSNFSLGAEHEFGSIIETFAEVVALMAFISGTMNR